MGFLNATGITRLITDLKNYFKSKDGYIWFGKNVSCSTSSTYVSFDTSNKIIQNVNPNGYFFASTNSVLLTKGTKYEVTVSFKNTTNTPTTVRMGLVSSATASISATALTTITVQSKGDESTCSTIYYTPSTALYFRAAYFSTSASTIDYLSISIKPLI